MNAASERQQAFRALRGERIPHVGEKAWWGGSDQQGKHHGGQRGKVVVVRVSASGKTIWTRFATEAQRRKFGREIRRWWLLRRGPAGSLMYCAFGGGQNSMYGTVHFAEHTCR